MDSAGGSAKQGRDRRVQAVYPLKGKPLNTFGKEPGKILDNVEVSDLCAALGLTPIDIAATEEEKDAWISRLQYHKVIVMSDADIDGCFTYETTVLTTEGPVAIGKMAEDYAAGKTYQGWAYDLDTKVIVEVPLLDPRETKLVDELVEVTFDNLGIVRCTPDHPFLLKDGTFVRAADLTPEMEIRDDAP